LVEIKIPANSTSTRFLIPDLPNLRQVHIWGLEVYYSKVDNSNVQFDIGVIPTGLQTQLPLIDLVALKKSFITLVNYGGKEFLKQAPSVIFNTIFNGQPNGSINPMEWNSKQFTGQRVNYPKSYIDFTAAPATNVDQCFMFSIYYSLPLTEEIKEGNYNFDNRK
jgi:hypothetical protein